MLPKLYFLGALFYNGFSILIASGGKMKKNSFGCFFMLLALVFFLAPFSTFLKGQTADKVVSLYEKFAWRTIGPAVMGGRTVDIDVVEKQPWIILAAIGPSGVWRSDNNGVNWYPVFYKENTVSGGDIAISQSNPDIIWVGTGEATCRNSVTIGDGIYKSVDGGKTWQNMGLKDTRHISRIIVNPGDPNIVFVAAMGHLWGPNEERGVYKTIDGGKTWKKVLYINKDTGFADLAMDPSDSLTLYAAAYEHRRLPYYFSSGGLGSGLYKTVDGGETWKRLTEDLPEGILGRIGICISRSRPNVVYALIEHKDGGIWRSEDKGESWKRMCDNETFMRVNTRPFYYSQIHVDPGDDKVVYVLSTGLFVSNDMGQKFKAIGAGTHSDHHGFWIDPSNPLHLIDGNDGGIDISYDGGKNWLPIQHMELAEVYQIAFDLRNPYYIYCGLQDNGSWGGPSASLDPVGITNEDWYMVGGGDGFFVQVDPNDPQTVYRNSQMNGLSRFDLRIRLGRNVKPLAPQSEPPYRFNWDSPIYISPHDLNVIYTGGNFLFKSEDRGHSWKIISSDLTTNDSKKQQDSGGPISLDNSGAESHCSITTISESSLEKGVIWCGTDDGNLQLTCDGGKSWTNVVRNIAGLPLNTWCSCIETSHFAAGTAYAAFDGHRQDDYATYVFKTADYGKTWKSIKGNLPFGWVNVIREDLKNKNLLFVGTEFSIFASLDGGGTWFSLKNNLPTAAVWDIAIHPRENDLIIGTHGRGIWILDDISFLEEMSPEVLDSELYLFNIRPFTEFLLASVREPFSKPAYAAKNPPYGLNITSFMKAEAKEMPRVSILDKNGNVVYELNLSKKPGIQRETWNLQFVPMTKEGKKITPPAAGFFALPLVPPGEYTVEIKLGEKKVSQKTVIHPDPRFDFKEEDRAAQLEALSQILAISKKMSLAVTGAKDIRRQLDSLSQDLKKPENSAEALQSGAKKFEEKFKKVEEEIVPREIFTRATREQALRGGAIAQQIMFLGMSLSGYPSRPTETDRAKLQELIEIVERQVSALNEIIKTDLPLLNEVFTQYKLKPLKMPKEVTLD
jgi:photosystem II stability/assembly factor-like uncharacterized protein